MEGFTMSDNPYYRELIDFRQTLQGWLTGTIPATEKDAISARLLGVIPEECMRITGDARLILDCVEDMAGLLQQHGAMPDFKMSLDDFCLHWEIDNLALVTFKEWTQIGDNVWGMQSSIVFRKNPDTPFGVEWLHYQETMLPETETES
jgi:hypothetical protein